MTKRQTYTSAQEQADYAEGADACPVIEWRDEQRGHRSFPGHKRCPFKRPERVAAWQRGYDDMWKQR